MSNDAESTTGDSADAPTITYGQASSAAQSCEALLQHKLDHGVMITLIRNKKRFEEAAKEYQSAHQALVNAHTLTDESGDPVFPTRTDPETGEEVEDRSGDPLFDDKAELVGELNDLLNADSGIEDIDTVSVYDLPEEKGVGRHVDTLSFMIDDLYD